MTTEAAGSAGSADDLDLELEALTGQPTSTTSATIPDKYVGKSVDELIKMHQNAERLNSRMGQEVSTVRRLADEIIGLKKPTTQVTEERKPVTVEALLNDPEKAIRDAIANSDVARRVESADNRANSLESSLSEQTFVTKHKDFAKDIENPDFLAWVNKNPLRQSMAAETAKKNFTAAQHLWDMWEEHKELVGATAGKTGAATKETKTVPTGVKSAPVDTGKGRQIYSRAKIMELKAKVHRGDTAAVARYNDPTFQENLNRAYAEDRVK